MIKKSTIKSEGLSAYCLVMDILIENKEYYLTKEEIFIKMPLDDEGVPLINIGGLESALRALSHTGDIGVEYIRGKRHFTYREKIREYR